MPATQLCEHRNENARKGASHPQPLTSCPPKASPAGNVTREEWWQQDGVFFREGGERQVKQWRSKSHIDSVKEVLALLKSKKIFAFGFREARAVPALAPSKSNRNSKEIWQQSRALGGKTGLRSNPHEFPGGTSALIPCHGLSGSWLQRREMGPFVHGTAAFRACSSWTSPSALALAVRQSRARGSAGRAQESSGPR